MGEGRPHGETELWRPSGLQRPDGEVKTSFGTVAGAWVLAVGVTTLIGYAQDTSAFNAVTTPTQFLSALEGSWAGQAEITPIGPRPYDITFDRVESNRVKGVANPGRALHHWAFFIQDDELRLRFLTTFGGNRDPIQFEAADWDEDGTTTFQALQPAFLKVKIRLDEEHLMMDVFHWDRLHVAIRLARG